MRKFLAVAILGLVGACADTRSPDQLVRVITEPAGASCTLDRAGQRIGTVAATPAFVRVPRGLTPIVVACSASGYQTTSASAVPGFAGSGWTNESGRAASPADRTVDARSYVYPQEIGISLAPGN